MSRKRFCHASWRWRRERNLFASRRNCHLHRADSVKIWSSPSNSVLIWVELMAQ